MSLPVFMVPSGSLGAPGDTAELAGPEGRHAVTVKRVRVGESLHLVDGRGTRATLQVTATAGKDRLVGRLLDVVQEDPPVPRFIVVQALPKSDRADQAVDLLTQGGVDCIVPWQADRCIARWVPAKRSRSQAKWQEAARTAAKQARRSYVPEVRDMVDTAGLTAMLKRRLADIPGTVALLLHEEAAIPLREQPVATAREVWVIVGPEGGIGEEEAAEIHDAGALPTLLGPEVLRCATAGFAALSALGALTNRW